MAIGKKVSDKVKNKLAGKEKGSRDPGPILRYPLNLVEKDNQELIRFRIVDRKTLEDQRSIYLYSPPGLSIADAAGYTQADLGLLGGAIDAGGDVMTGKKDMDACAHQCGQGFYSGNRARSDCSAQCRLDDYGWCCIHRY